MKIKQLEAEGVFSFGIGDNRFILDLDEPLTVIVGPNASGKSNVTRVLNLIQTAVRLDVGNQEDRTALQTVLDDHVRSALHDGVAPGLPVTVRLAIEFTSGEEVDLMTSFVRSAILRALLHNMSADQPGLSALEAWTYQSLTHEVAKPFFAGTIAVSHSGIPGMRWNVAYEFDYEQTQLTWHIHSDIPNLTSVIAPRGWTANDGLPLTESLYKRLTGQDQPFGGQLLPPEKPFTFEALLPASYPTAAEGMSMVAVQMDSVNANVAPAPHRAFANAFRMSVGTEPIDLARRTHNLSSVLSPILDRGLWFLGVAGASLDTPIGGMGLPGSSDRQLNSPVPRSDVWMLPSRLNRFKNGTQTDQARYQAIQALFQELAPGYRFDLRTEWRREDAEHPPIPFIAIEIFPSDSTAASAPPARPLHFAGTGVEQSLILAETLAGEPDRVLVLDEPASNLHPAWQRIVRSHLCNRFGQCILVTHSPYLVPTDSAEHLAAIVRISRRGGATRVNRMTKSDLNDSRWVNTIVKELAWSADARALLFASGVVLVEGETELSALPIWSAKSQLAQELGGPDDLHIAFLSVGGDTAFGSFLYYLEHFGVPWVVVCDGAAFRFDTSKHIFEQVIESGTECSELKEYVEKENIFGKNQTDMTDELFQSMVGVGRENGVFTLASGWTRKSEGDDQESFEAFVSSRSELVEPFTSALNEAGRSKPRVGRLLADATECPADVNDLYRSILTRLVPKE